MRKKWKLSEGHRNRLLRLSLRSLAIEVLVSENRETIDKMVQVAFDEIKEKQRAAEIKKGGEIAQKRE